jgi:hypothetical protein
VVHAPLIAVSLITAVSGVTHLVRCGTYGAPDTAINPTHARTHYLFSSGNLQPNTGVVEDRGVNTSNELLQSVHYEDFQPCGASVCGRSVDYLTVKAQCLAATPT